MSLPNICAELSRGLGPLFVCTTHGEYERVRTPYLYPDGDNIDLFCKVDGDLVTVSDLGETVRWLRMQTATARRSPKQRALIEDACLTHGVEFQRGMLLAQGRTDASLAGTITRVAQAALRVSDLWFTFRTRSADSVTNEVEDFLNERQLQFVRSETLGGRSGRDWTVDFHVQAGAHSSLVYVLSTGSRSAAHSIAEHVLAAWYDLRDLATGPNALRFVSLFDDTVEVWSEGEFRLLEELSAITRWSEPDQFAAALSAAA